MKRLVLAGAGHAHALLLKAWERAPPPGVELLLVSPNALAPYSGMVPGWLAGHYRYDEICVDFAPLVAATGARWLADEVQGVQADQRRLLLRSGAVLDYDLLSLNVGSTLTPPTLDDKRNVHLLPLRPLSQLHAAWQATQAMLANLPDDQSDDQPLHLRTVGAGAAGIETLLALRHWLNKTHPLRTVHASLLSQSAELLPSLAPGAQRSVRRALGQAGVDLRLGTGFDAARDAGSDDGTQLLVWATGAQAHAWQRDSGLALDEPGFIRIDSQLRSISHPEVYAVGDCAAWATPLPKAGVHAVRMAPVLAHNLRAALAQQGAPIDHRPQRRFLALLALGQQRAVAAWGPFSAEGAWAWRWKDRIDRAFLRRVAA